MRGSLLGCGGSRGLRSYRWRGGRNSTWSYDRCSRLEDLNLRRRRHRGSRRGSRRHVEIPRGSIAGRRWRLRAGIRRGLCGTRKVVIATTASSTTARGAWMSRGRRGHYRVHGLRRHNCPPREFTESVGDDDGGCSVGVCVNERV